MPSLFFSIYNAADDGADGYSSVNVNVAIPHGTILVGSNFNNAPVSQRLSPKDFLRSLCEATYNVAAKYITNASYRARFEQDMAEMTWINDYFPGIYDRDDLVFFGAGGHPGGTGAGIYIWFWCIGIADESATISASKFITDESISGDGCDVILSSGNKFYRSDFNRCGSYSFARIPIINTEGYQSAIENISNHTLESESASPYTRSLNRSNLGTSVGTYNTGLMTNLTGGSLS